MNWKIYTTGTIKNWYKLRSQHLLILSPSHFHMWYLFMSFLPRVCSILQIICFDSMHVSINIYVHICKAKNEIETVCVSILIKVGFVPSSY